MSKLVAKTGVSSTIRVVKEVPITHAFLKAILLKDFADEVPEDVEISITFTVPLVDDYRGDDLDLKDYANLKARWSYSYTTETAKGGSDPSLYSDAETFGNMP